MKTLVNKRNPLIRITAPEITTEASPYNNYQYVYWIPAINEMYNPIDWTLVEEEQPEEICSKCIHNRRDEAYCYNLHGQRWINGNGVYKCTEFCEKEQEEPVDLEKEYQEFCKDNPFPWSSQYVNREYIDELCLSVARHFYELGRIAQIEQNKALADMHKSPKEKEE